MIVVITAEAEVDLERIGDHIAIENPERAVSFLRELRDRCNQLADIPNGFPIVPRFEHLGVRRRVHRDYLIFYRLGTGTIDVLHVLHGAVDYEPILFREPRRAGQL